jgi:hypothetical protein
MKRLALMLVLFTATTCLAADWQAVETILGRSGTSLPGGVYKFAFPRADLQVDVDGIRIRPALALGSWAAFNGTMQPRLFFMHFWGNDDAIALAKTLRSALDAMKH